MSMLGSTRASEPQGGDPMTTPEPPAIAGQVPLTAEEKLAKLRVFFLLDYVDDSTDEGATWGIGIIDGTRSDDWNEG